MLFSEGATPETWVTVAASAVSGAVILTTAYFAYLGSRDRTRITTLEANVADCQEKHKECEDNHALATAELAAVRAEAKARDARDKAEMQAQITDLKAQVAHKKDDTGDYKPHGGS